MAIKKKVESKKPGATKEKKSVKKVLVKPSAKKEKPIGEVTHFFGKIKVAIIKFKAPVKVGAEIWLKGATTDFKQTIQSMQFDHQPVNLAEKGKEVGIKVQKQVREGDVVYPAPHKG